MIVSFLILFISYYKKKVQDLNYFSLTDKNDFLILHN